METQSARCTGTLIHPRVVLTAGHCISDSDNPIVHISGGATGEDLLAVVDRVEKHPDNWQGSFSFDAPDLALLLLSVPLAEISPFRLRDFPAPSVGDTAVIVGYGIDPSDTESTGPVHREGKTSLLDIGPYYIEIGGETNTCFGDSGGPLFTEQNGEWALTGVTSFGPDSCPVEAQGYDVKLLAFCDWLNDTMTELVGEDLGLELCRSCRSVPPPGPWGAPCGPGYSCCPSGTECRLPADFSRSGLGYCAPTCCNPGTAEPAVCTDISPGEEGCFLSDDRGNAFCAVRCGSDSDCPEGTACKNKPFESEKICIAVQQGDGPDCDAFGSDGSDTGTDEGVSTDSETESDNAPDTDAPLPQENTAAGGCTAVGTGAPSIMKILYILLDMGG